VATGGGGSIHGTAGLGDDRFLEGYDVGLDGVSARPRTDWFSAWFSMLGTGPRSRIVSYVICAKRRSPGSTLIKTEQGFEVRAGGLLYVRTIDQIDGAALIESDCGSGREVTGGGTLTLSDEGHLGGSYPVIPGDPQMRVRAWRGWLYDADASTSTAHIDAICQHHSKPLVSHLQYVTRGPVPVTAPATRTAVARCRGNRVVAGGGVFVNGNVSEAEVTLSAPVDLGDGNGAPDDGWTARVLNETGAAKSLSVFAICGRG
jgi:hypothetical protein